MFFVNYSTYEGEPARLYRSPDRIREDICEIRTQIQSVDSKLNIRNILTAIIDEVSEGNPERWIPALAAIVKDAEDTLKSLNSLKESLDLLGEELEDTRWALGI